MALPKGPAARGDDPIEDRRLGQDLVRWGALSAESLEWAEGAQQRTGVRLRHILVAAGLVDRRAVFEALAIRWQVPLVDLTEELVDQYVGRDLDPQLLIDESWIPLRRDPDGVIVVATSERPTTERCAAIEEAVGRAIRPVATTDWDVVQAVQSRYHDVLADRAAYGLWRRSPDRSAHRVVTGSQVSTTAGVLLIAAITALLYPKATLGMAITAAGMFFLIGVTFKFVVCMAGARAEADQDVFAHEVAALRDEELPVYTILVPVYREANIVGQLIENLGGIDYPTAKLEILLLLEEDDHETIAAAQAADPPKTIQFVVVPNGTPKTKPKACNVGLFFARGEYLVIYDAEDRPDPDQLKRAIVAFQKADRATVCVQAALNYWNADENALTRMFTLEYSFWFDYMLPGLHRLGLPIPLGGTSNHFRTEELRDLGGWDPFNVTEDADLGIRAAALGYRVAVVDSTTYEEANRAVGNWIRQRSRWVKGYMQTLLVHLRHPVELVRTAGLRQALAFALLVGGTPIAFLAAPILWVAFLATFVLGAANVTNLIPPWALYISIIDLILGNGLMIYVSMMGAFKRRRYQLVLWALLNPAYWVLPSIASYKALWQLIAKPHYWEKTAHGISKLDVGSADAAALWVPGAHGVAS